MHRRDEARQVARKAIAKRALWADEWQRCPIFVSGMVRWFGLTTVVAVKADSIRCSTHTENTSFPIEHLFLGRKSVSCSAIIFSFGLVVLVQPYFQVNHLISAPHLALDSFPLNPHRRYEEN